MTNETQKVEPQKQKNLRTDYIGVPICRRPFIFVYTEPGALPLAETSGGYHGFGAGASISTR